MTGTHAPSENEGQVQGKSWDKTSFWGGLAGSWNWCSDPFPCRDLSRFSRVKSCSAQKIQMVDDCGWRKLALSQIVTSGAVLAVGYWPGG